LPPTSSSPSPADPAHAPPSDAVAVISLTEDSDDDDGDADRAVAVTQQPIDFPASLPEPLAARLPGLFATHPALRATLQRIYASSLSPDQPREQRRRNHRGGGGGKQQQQRRGGDGDGGVGEKDRAGSALALLIELRMRDEGVAAFVELVCSAEGQGMVGVGGGEEQVTA
jgi:hypothetical protein